jgi:hypothetical protein
MIDPNELLELGRERQRTLIAWRGNQRRLNKLPPLEMAAVKLLSQVMLAIIIRLRSLDQVHTVIPIGTNRSRRKLR